MKKILIITLYGNCNFGNKLQNYALQESIKKQSNKFTVETQVIKYEKISNNFMIILLWKIYNFFNSLLYINNIRHRKFLEFNKKFINYTKNKVTINSKSKISDYDYYVYGSDQVWNPNGTGKSDIYLGYLTDNNVSYAASLSADIIPDNQKNRYYDCLKRFKAISVREEKGKDILEDLNLNNVEVLVDPTMLLTAEEWDVVLEKPLKNVPKKYILNYFLGNVPEEVNVQIEKIAKEHNCEIINILDKNDLFYNSGPGEFLYLEKNAFLICTDSFHSSVFAIIYNRPFVVFERNSSGGSMFSRIDTLLSKFKLENRKYNGKNITKENLNHDYSNAYKVLKIEREKSKIFFEKYLNEN